MNPNGRFVFDTNTIVSALLFADSIPNRAFCGVDRSGILLSRETFTELQDVLRRPKFDRYVDSAVREAFLETIAVQFRIVPTTEVIRSCRDPKDDKFLELAVAGDANCIVTGDHDLLTLHPFRGIAILTPTQFLEALGKTDSIPN